MIVNFFKSIFGSRNDRIINGYSKELVAINKLENDLINLSDNELKNKSNTLKDLIKKVKLVKVNQEFVLLQSAEKLVRECFP